MKGKKNKPISCADFLVVKKAKYKNHETNLIEKKLKRYKDELIWK